jgi:hypothetical protein
MRKELPVILVNQGGGPEKNNRKKMEGRGGGEAQGVADPKKHLLTGDSATNVGVANASLF